MPYRIKNAQNIPIDHIKIELHNLLSKLPRISLNFNETNEARQERKTKLEPQIQIFLQELYNRQNLNNFLLEKGPNNSSPSDDISSKLYQVSVYQNKVSLINRNSVRDGEISNPNIYCYEDYFKAFQMFNPNDKKFQGCVIEKFVQNLIQKIFIINDTLQIKVNDIGYGDALITKKIIQTLIKLDIKPDNIMLDGYDFRNGSKADVLEELKGILPNKNINLKNCRFGQDNHDYNEEPQKYNLIFASHLYSMDFVNKIKEGKLDNIMGNNSIFIATHNFEDTMQEFRKECNLKQKISKASKASNSYEMLPYADNYTNTLEKVCNEKNYKCKTFSYKYSFKFPEFSEDQWQFLKNIPTAQYDFNFSKALLNFNDKNFLEKINFLNFFLIGPIQSIELEQRSEILDDLKERIKKDPNISYIIKVDAFVEMNAPSELIEDISNAISELGNDEIIKTMGIDINTNPHFF